MTKLQEVQSYFESLYAEWVKKQVAGAKSGLLHDMVVAPGAPAERVEKLHKAVLQDGGPDLFEGPVDTQDPRPMPNSLALIKSWGARSPCAG